VPKNPKNPYYSETNKKTNPLGYNPLGLAYIDLGLGDYLYPAKGLPAGNIGPGSNGQGDFLFVNGTFKVPTLRNVDKRPNATFVKAYMHNGYFKSLKDIVHFYNTRNLTTLSGEVIDFTTSQPYASLKGKPLWPPPEYLSSVTMQNAEGLSGRVGNLGLTEQDENDIVAFLKTLSDGYTQP
jgi:cytochrome c peroxidase